MFLGFLFFVFCLVLMMPSKYPLPVSGSAWEHFPVAVEVYPPWLLCFLCIFFKPQQEQTGQPRKILSFYSIAQRQKTKPGKMSVKMTFLPRYKCSHTVQPAAPSAVLVLHTLSTQNGGGGETSFFFLSFFISCHP